MVQSYTARNFADAMLALLPPGAAWEWPQGGTGDALMVAMGQELARVQAALPAILDGAISMHKPGSNSFTLADYRAVAQPLVAGLVEGQRRPLRVGSKTGDRLWSHVPANFAVPAVQLDFMRPERVGSKVGQCLWGYRARVVLRVRYYVSVVDPAPLWQALYAFKQAHIFLWFEDITGAGGAYGQN